MGPPVVRASGARDAAAASSLIVVSWNIAIGEGDVSEALADIRAAHPGAPFVLLIQEAFREGPEVPRRARGDLRFASRLGDDDEHERVEIEAVAERERLNLYYVPSMRNGGPAVSDEDRGNAILSTLPLSDLTAIELPFERQRRVAIAATVSGRTPDGRPWRLRVVSVHLDNMMGARRGWIFGSEFARVRQARAILEHVQDDEAVVLAGDFNTWFGFREQTTSEIARAFPESDLHDRRPTFAGILRLDHLFYRLPEGWRGHVRRADARYGSDHHPLVATIAIGAQQPAIRASSADATARDGARR